MDEQRRAIERVARAYFDEDIEVTEARRRRQGLGLRLDGKVTRDVALFLGENPSLVYRIITDYSKTRMFYDNGRACSWSISSRCKVWKSRPLEFYLKLRYDLKRFTEITQENASDWTTIEPLPVLHQKPTNGRNKFLCRTDSRFGLQVGEIPVAAWNRVTCPACLSIIALSRVTYD